MEMTSFERNAFWKNEKKTQLFLNTLQSTPIKTEKRGKEKNVINLVGESVRTRQLGGNQPDAIS